MSFSDYLENKVVDHAFGVASFTSPTPYVALFTTNPNEAGTGGVEVSGGSYARKTVTFSAASGGVSANSAVVQFLNMPATTLTGFGIYDALTGGNLLAVSTLTGAPVSVSNTQPVEFSVGDLTVSVS